MRILKLTSLLATGFCACFALRAHADPLSYLHQIQLPEAQKLTLGSPALTIAVLSTGMNSKLPGLAQSLAVNAGETGDGRESDGLDNEGNGYIDDVYGVDAHTGLSEFSDSPSLGFGTYEAALIASPAFGIARGSKILPVRILDSSGSSCGTAIGRGVDYALSRGARIIFVAIGGVLEPSEICDAVARADDQGALVIAPAGNSGAQIDATWLPAGCHAKNLVIAAASDENSALAGFSNWSPKLVQLAAPGVAIPGLSFNGGNVFRSGTSVSAAVTTGVAALVWSLHPAYSAEQVKEALILGSDTQESLAGKVLSNGRINAFRALMVNP